MIVPNVIIRDVQNQDRKGAGSLYWRDIGNGYGKSFEWETYDHFIRDAELIAKHSHVSPNRLMEEGGNSWVGFRGTGDQLMRTIEHGWPEMRQQLERMLEGSELETPAVAAKAVMRRRKRTRADHGDSLDMARVWNGDMERAWELPKRTEHLTVTTKRVTLAIDVASACMIRPEEALWRAALGLKLSDSLVRAGRILEIWAVQSISEPWQNSREDMWCGWCVKQTKDPLVLDRLCSMFTLAFFRIAGFLAYHADTTKRESYGRGRVMNYGLPYTLKERQNSGELVLRIGECYSQQMMIKEYNRAWQEVIKHSDEVMSGVTNDSGKEM